jgi:uncharacterized coiled-coil protein SlyX
VVGVDRSGSSLCANLLHEAGIYLGNDLAGGDEFNERGYFESAETLSINNAVLAEMNCSWETLYGLQPLVPFWWRTASMQGWLGAVARLIQNRLGGTEGTLGFKDPRFCVLLPLWKEAFAVCGLAPRFLLTLRHPGAVAKSLESRNGFSTAYAELYWMEHYCAAVEAIRDAPYFIVDYDQWFTSPTSQARAMLDFLGPGAACAPLDLASNLPGVVDPRLRHSDGAAEGIRLEAVERLYLHLKSRHLPEPEVVQELQSAAEVAEAYSVVKRNEGRHEWRSRKSENKSALPPKALAVQGPVNSEITRDGGEPQRADADKEETLRHGRLACLEAELERLKVGLASDASRLKEVAVALETELTGRLQEICSLQGATELSTGNFKVLSRDLPPNSERIAALTTAVENGETRISELELRLAQQTAEIDRLNADLAQQSFNNQALRSDVVLRDRLLLAAKLEAQEHSLETLSLRGTIHNLTAELERSRSEVSEHLAESKALNSEVAKLDAERERLAATGTALRSEVEQKSKEAVELRCKVALQEEEINRRVNELADAHGAAQAVLDAARNIQEAHALADRIRVRELSFLDRELRTALNETQQALKKGDLRSIVRNDVHNYRRQRRLRKLFSDHRLFDAGWYLSQYADVLKSRIDPLTHFIRYGASEGRDPHPLFCTSWYVREYPEVADEGRNPLEDYILNGVEKSRDPNPLFETGWYLMRNPDVAQAGVNPLRHYLEYGAAEGRDPSSLFDTDWYLERYPDVAGQNPLAHYLRSGHDRDPNPLFNAKYYLSQNPQLCGAETAPLAHYLRYWKTEAGDPHELFLTDWYLKRYPDVVSSGMNPLVHYVDRGAMNGCDPHPWFDSDWYLEKYSDVRNSGENPLADYVRRGSVLQRDPHSRFDTKCYLECHPDLAEARVNPLIHFLAHEESKVRDPNAMFDRVLAPEQNGATLAGSGAATIAK